MFDNRWLQMQPFDFVFDASQQGD
jgi:hypothetical protein